MLRGCEGDSNAGVEPGGGVVAMIAECECMDWTRGSGVVSSAYDVLEMSVVRGIGGVCEMCMCFGLWRGSRCGGVSG